MVFEKISILAKGIPLNPLPVNGGPDPMVPHAPKHQIKFTDHENVLAVNNALRYFPKDLHEILRPEFKEELDKYGHIYMYRFKPNKSLLKSQSIHNYPAKIQDAAAIMLMICNNLDHDVAQFPEELVTYGSNGQVFSNWAQFWLTMKYLAKMNSNQTLVLYSGHPMGLFPAVLPYSPRVVITNGMMVPNYSNAEDYGKLFALGATMYGQMTAGSYCYIGPQGIVHGTTITLMNAIRNQPVKKDDVKLKKVFISSGLGGMSGAQAKAAVISNCIGVIAEVSEDALMKRYNQRWVEQICKSIPDVLKKIKEHIQNNKATSIGYLGNVVDLWEALVEHHKKTNELLADIGSDQTSCHILNEGGYFPVGISYKESLELIRVNKSKFKKLINESLNRHVKAINYLSEHGLYFFDYGNAFLLQASKAGADTHDKNSVSLGGVINKFRYPSYVQDIMGDVFSMGFGPFRWVCTSGDINDLRATDKIAEKVISELIEEIKTNTGEHIDKVRQQYRDNLIWIQNAEQHNLVVGSKARILYADTKGREMLAKAFNCAINEGTVSAPIVLSRDHHDVSGTDSPFRETSNVYDGSAVCSDMAVQNIIGDSFRGATWVSLHNGGGVGWGQAINGGFGLVLNGSEEADIRAKSMLNWDVMNGISRRMWSGNALAYQTVKTLVKEVENYDPFIPQI